MCYGSPAKSLELARSRLTPEQWNRFEREFDDFCVVQGLQRRRIDREDMPGGTRYWWAKWAFFQGRQHSGHEFSTFTEAQWNSLKTAGQRVADAKYTRVAIAMMSDEQAQMSLERWEQVNLEIGE